MKRNIKSNEIMRLVACPQCNKRRMTKPLGVAVNLEQREYQTKDNNKITLFVDICEHCKKLNWSRYFEPTRADIRRVISAMHNQAPLQENESLENLL